MLKCKLLDKQDEIQTKHKTMHSMKIVHYLFV